MYFLYLIIVRTQSKQAATQDSDKQKYVHSAMSGHTPRSDVDQISDECSLSARLPLTHCESAAGGLLPSTSSIRAGVKIVPLNTCYEIFYILMLMCRAVTSTTRIYTWWIVECFLDIEVSYLTILFTINYMF